MILPKLRPAAAYRIRVRVSRFFLLPRRDAGLETILAVVNPNNIYSVGHFTILWNFFVIATNFAQAKLVNVWLIIR